MSENNNNKPKHPLGWDNLFDEALVQIMMGQDTWEYYQGFSKIHLPLLKSGNPLTSHGKELQANIQSGASNIEAPRKIAKKKKIAE